MSDQSDANAGTDSKKAQPTRAASSRSGERDPQTSTGSNVADCHSTGKVADSHCKKSKKSKVSKSTESGRSPSNRSGRERSHERPRGTSASSEKRTVTVELSQNGGGSGGQGNAGRQRSRSASPSHAPSVLPDVASLIQAEMAKFAATMARKRARSTSSSSDSSSDSSESEADRGRSRKCKGRHDRRRRARRASRSSSSSSGSSRSVEIRSPPKRMRHKAGSKQSRRDTRDTGSSDRSSDRDSFTALDDAIRAANHADSNVSGNVIQLDDFGQIMKDLEDFVEVGEQVGEGVNDAFASILGSNLRRKPNDKAVLRTAEAYPRPQNIPNLQTPKTNINVYRKMRRKVQVVDSKLQQVQTTIGKALTPIIRMMNDIGTGSLKNKPIQDYLNQINDALRMGTAAFSYMNQARKEIIRNDLGYSFGQLCSWEYAVPTEHLFSEKVVKQLKEITDTRHQFDDLTNRPYPRYGGSRGGKRGGYGGSSSSYSRDSRGPKHGNDKWRNKSSKGMEKYKKHKGENYEVCETDVACSNLESTTQSISSASSLNEASSAEMAPSLTLENTVDNFCGGKLAGNIHEWEKLTSDQWILNSVQGFSIEFNDLPSQQFRPHEIKLSTNEKAGLDAEIVEFKRLKIVEPCPADEPDSFYGNLFVRTKRDGSLRVIFNLKQLTPHLEKHHFKMETVKDAIFMMRPDCLFSSIDFKHAFYSIPILNEHRKYLRFIWQGQHLQFTCLPQGLGPASRTFTKILKPVLAHLRSMGLNISTYIDDSFCDLDDDDEYDFIMLYAAKLLDKLGFTINIDKSVLPPTRTKIMTSLGFVFNSIDMTVQLTPAKQDCISALAGSLLNNNKPTIQQLAQFIGKLVAAEPGYDYAPLYYKNIEIFQEPDALKAQRQI